MSFDPRRERPSPSPSPNKALQSIAMPTQPTAQMPPPECSLCGDEFHSSFQSFPISWTSIARSVRASIGETSRATPGQRVMHRRQLMNQLVQSQIAAGLPLPGPPGLGPPAQPLPTPDRVEPVLSGCGFVRHPHLFTAVDGESSFEGQPLDQLQSHSILTHFDPYFKTFAFHQVCWQLLLTRIEQEQGVVPDHEVVATWLFHLLSSLVRTREDRLIINYQHVDPHDRRSTERSSLLREADMYQIPSSVEEADQHLLSPSHLSSVSYAWLPQDPFSLLPREVRYHLLTWLPSQDVCNARLASRPLAICGSPSVLPQAFWESRFSAGNEMDFVFSLSPPSSQSPTPNWRSLYYRSKEWIRQGETRFPGFANRRRIWRFLGGLVPTLTCLFSVQNPPNPSYENGRSLIHPLGHRASCKQLLLPEEPFFRSYLPLDFDMMPSQTSTINFDKDLPKGRILLQVSTIPLDSKIWISGFVLSSESGGWCKVIQEAGTIVSSRLKAIWIDDWSSVVEIVAYLSPEGLHCLVLSIKQIDGSIEAISVGETEMNDCYSLVTKLVPSNSTLGLAFEFIGIRLVSLQLIEGPSSHSNTISRNALWNPTLPHDHNKEQWADMKDSEKKPLINLFVDFGGRDGYRLSSLRSVTAFLTPDYGFHGFAFAYDDGDEVFCGSHKSAKYFQDCGPGIGQSFLIDGRRGERINKIAYSSPQFKFIHIVEISTNFNRNFVFGALDSLCPDLSGEIVVDSPPGYIPTRFMARIRNLKWAFEAVKFDEFIEDSNNNFDASLKYAVATTPKIPFTTLRAGEWMLHGYGACFTSATLSDVKSICVSVGTKDYSRGEYNISGLLLRYADSRRDCVVGQWIKEAGCFCLAPQEKLVEVRLWFTNDHHHRATLQANALGRPQRVHMGMDGHPLMAQRFGQVVGIEFKTLRDMCYRFCPETQVEKYEVRYRATPYEDLGDITWAANVDMDNVQVNLEPKAALAGGHLFLYNSLGFLQQKCLPEGPTRVYFTTKDPDMTDRAFFAHEAYVKHKWPREVLLWHEMEGARKRIARLEAITITVDSENTLMGLEFDYDGLPSRKFGSDRGRQSRLRLSGSGEQLSLLMVFTFSGEKKGFEFRTTNKQIIRAMPSQETPDRVSCFHLLPEVEVPAAMAEFPVVDQYEMKNLGSQDEEIWRSVGIWVTGIVRENVQIQGIEDIGPIYLSRPKRKPRR